MCLQVNNKSPHVAQCVKSRLLNKAIDSILSIDTFQQQCVVIKYMLQSSRLEDHMKTIGVDQSSFARSSFEHRCMNNIKNIYQHAGKCDDQQNLKNIMMIQSLYFLQVQTHLKDFNCHVIIFFIVITFGCFSSIFLSSELANDNDIF